MNKNIENVLTTLDVFRTDGEMTYSAYSILHDEISLLDDLLKEQEPRVLTLDEVMALPNGEEDEAVVVREFWLPIGDVWNGKTVCTWMGARDVQNVADWVYGFFHKSEYGHNWRCWTAMPTKAQREAAKWDD